MSVEEAVVGIPLTDVRGRKRSRKINSARYLRAHNIVNRSEDKPYDSKSDSTIQALGIGLTTQSRFWLIQQTQGLGALIDT